jgi:Uncharacterised methyltransferase family (DUF6094)
MARNASRLKLGYYPLVPNEAVRLRRCLEFPPEFAVFDPCAGTGIALQLITSEVQARRYGIELDSFRAAEARRVLDEVVQGSVFDCHCAVESYSMLYLNPPYDDEIAEGHNRRMEGVFLEHCFRWLRPGGVLLLVIPCGRIGSCSAVLAAHFRDLAIYRLSEPEAVRYSQIAIFGIRRTRREKEKLHDREVAAAREMLFNSGRSYGRLPALPDRPDRVYAVPPGPANVRLTYRGLPLDVIEDLLPFSRAYRQGGRILFAPEVQLQGRPLTPLHAGHVGILSCSGLLNGVFGTGEARHVACWEAGKVVDRFEETDDQQVTTIRERERFTQRLTLVFADGRTAVLSEEDPDAKRAPEDGPA